MTNHASFNARTPGVSTVFDPPPSVDDAAPAIPPDLSVDLASPTNPAPLAPAPQRIAAAPVSASAADLGIQLTAAAQMTQPPAVLDFTSGPTSITGGTDGFYFSLPGVLYHHYGINLGKSFGGFSINAYANVAAGIKGAVNLGLGNVTTDYPVTLDQGTPQEVVDGTYFAVQPSLISVNNAGFSLAMVNASATADLALTANVGASFSTPSVDIGVNVPFIGFVGFTIPSQSFSKSFGVGNAYHLPTDQTITIPGGSMLLSQIPQTTQQSGSQSAWGTLPSISLSGTTIPFLSGNVDFISLLADILEFDGLSGSYSAGPLSASYSLLNLPIDIALSLGESVTLTPTGITVTATDLLTNETHSGPLGSIFAFQAPLSGSGAIPMSLAYTLDIDVSTSIGLIGHLDMTLDGPTASLSVLGIGKSIGPLFSFDLVNLNGQIAPIASFNTTQHLTQTSTVDIPFAGVTSTQTISGPSGGVTLATGGALLSITDQGTIASPGYGITSTTPAQVLIDNSGTIEALGQGISLHGGGVVRNHTGALIHNTGTAVLGTYGIDAGTALASVVFNNGTIDNFGRGIDSAGGSVTNDAEGLISATYTGIRINANARAINAGTITAATGIALPAGGYVYTTPGSLIDAGLAGINTSAALTLVNKGTITSVDAAVSAVGGRVTNFAGATMSSAAYTGVVIEGPSATLENAGTITGMTYAAVLSGATNLLALSPGAVFGGIVRASGTSNAIALRPGGAGTLAGLGSAYIGFTSVTLAPTATWTLSGPTPGFTGVTIAGLSADDGIDLIDIPFNAYDTARVDPASDVLTFYGPTPGSVLATIHLAGTFAIHDFDVVSDGAVGSLLRPAAVNPQRVIGANAGILLAAKSYFGTAVSVAYTGSLGLSVASAYGIDAQEPNATITNHGGVVGTQIGIFLEQGGTVTNGVPGTYPDPASAVGSSVAGVSFGTAAGTLYNTFGTVAGGNYGVVAGYGGLVTNGTSSLIQGLTAINFFSARGTVRNAGTIIGGNAGVNILAGGTVVNDGSINVTGTASTGVRSNSADAMLVNRGPISAGAGGVRFTAGGEVYNAGATIAAAGYGVRILGIGTIDNFAGSITGVVLQSGGAIDNWAATLSASGYYGVGVYVVNGFGPATYIQNEGTGHIAGLRVDSATTIVNDASSTIDGFGIGVVDTGVPGNVFTLDNAGMLQGFGTGTPITAIRLDGSASITNRATGTITSAGTAIVCYDGGSTTRILNTGLIQGDTIGIALNGNNVTLENAGTIAGASGAVNLTGSGSNLLIVDPGAVFTGAVQVNALASNTLALAAGGPGTLANIGVDFSGFGTLDLRPGASWTLTGAIHLAGATALTLEAASTLTLAGTITGPADFSLDGAVLATPAKAGFTIDHPAAGTANTLHLTGLAAAVSFNGTISNLRGNDRIELPDLTFAPGDTAVYDGGAGTLSIFEGVTEVFSFSHLTLGPGAPATFTVEPHAIQEAACFAAGSRILTTQGEIAVEDIVPGMPVIRADGRIAPVIWTGRRRLDLHRHPRPHDVWPVRIRKDAFGPGMPLRDLRLSPDHAVLADGVLVPVRYLLNGRSIVQEPAESIIYHHIELASHAAVLAEGLPCETYLDTGNRAAFENQGAATTLHPDFARGIWAAKACAELVTAGPRLVGIRRRLLDLASDDLTGDPALRVLADDRAVVPECIDGTWHLALPPGVRRLRLVSRVCIPAETIADQNDTRALGVAIADLRIDGAEIATGSAHFAEGWHPPEAGWRWTSGDATLIVDGARRVSFRTPLAGRYWRAPAEADRLASSDRALGSKLNQGIGIGCLF